MRTRLLPMLLAVCIAGVLPVAAQQPRALTAADYARAEKFLAQNVSQLVIGGNVSPGWLSQERFWFRSQTAAGTEFLLVDPARGSRTPAFDHTRLAAALSAASGSTYDARQLPFQTIELSPDGKTVSFDAAGRRWSCDVQGAKCAAAGEATGARGGAAGGRGGQGGRGGGMGNAVASPDGKRAVYIRDWNLWVRDTATGQEKQLTTDGVKYFGYATDNAGLEQQRPRHRALVARIRRRSRPTSRTSARSARCTSSTRP